MSRQRDGTASSRSRAAATRSRNADSQRTQGSDAGKLPEYVMDDLYQVYHFLGKDTRRRLGLIMKIPVFIKDPLVARESPELGIQEIDVRLESGVLHLTLFSRGLDRVTYASYRLLGAGDFEVILR